LRLSLDAPGAPLASAALSMDNVLLIRFPGTPS
jgi:hypothetical protein